MAPKIRFFHGARGHRVAYAIDGRGPLLVLSPWWVSHVERDFEEPPFRTLFQKLAESLTVVRYDRPGVGLSDRDRTELTLDDEVETLERLVAELGGHPVALFGGSCGGPPAVRYAAQHPEQTSHLILYGTYACGARIATDDLKQAMMALVRANWGLGSKALVDLFAPDHTSEERKRFAALQRESASPEMAAQLLGLTYQMDVAEIAATVRVPTLVLHRKDDRAIPLELGRDLASRIPGAIFAPLTGNAHLPWIGDWKAVAEAVQAFIAPRAQEPAENAFVRDGEVWHLAFAGRRCHLKHARGLVDLALLLGRPGEELPAAQLMDGAVPPPASHEPILDDRARAQIRERLELLDDQLAGAEAAGNQPAAIRATEEKEALLRELRAATGLRGRKRALPDAGERARKAVTARIRDSIDKIKGQLPELGHHLEESIVTGTYCAYRPKQPTTWRV